MGPSHSHKINPGFWDFDRVFLAPVAVFRLLIASPAVFMGQPSELVRAAASSLNVLHHGLGRLYAAYTLGAMLGVVDRPPAGAALGAFLVPSSRMQLPTA